MVELRRLKEVTPAEHHEPKVRRRKPPRATVRAVLMALGPLLVLIVGGYLYATGGRYVSVDNAYIRADKVSISAEVAGRVAEVAVVENQPVKAGQMLFRIDDEPFDIAYAKAEAQLKSRRDEIDAFRASYQQRLAQIEMDRVSIDFYKREYDRQKELAKRAIVTQSQFDTARHNYDVALQQELADRQDLARILASLGGDPNIPAEKHPLYLAAQAQRDQAALDLRRTRVLAPADGTISNITLRPGDYVKAETPVFSLIESDRRWIEANIKETDLTCVRQGQKATIDVDTYPGVTWDAHVQSLSSATGSEFALLPPQNATGNWVKVVQRVPVRLVIDPKPDQPPLRAGMSVTVEIDTGHERGLFGLFGGGGDCARP
jgi:membrane fusion protein (multidrug efflux system)